MKVPLHAQEDGADLISLSAHKIGGPKGVGALYIAPALQSKMIPLLRGGGQEQGLRSGTEATAQIAGFAKAVAQRADQLEEILAHTRAMRTMLWSGFCPSPPCRCWALPTHLTSCA